MRFLFGLHIISTRTPTNPGHTHGPGFYRRAATDSDGVGATGKQERTSFFGEVTHVLNDEQRRDLRTGKYTAGICTVGEETETGGGSLFTAPVARGGRGTILQLHIFLLENRKKVIKVSITGFMSQITVLLCRNDPGYSCSPCAAGTSATSCPIPLTNGSDPDLTSQSAPPCTCAGHGPPFLCLSIFIDLQFSVFRQPHLPSPLRSNKLLPILYNTS